MTVAHAIDIAATIQFESVGPEVVLGPHLVADSIAGSLLVDIVHDHPGLARLPDISWGDGLPGTSSSSLGLGHHIGWLWSRCLELNNYYFVGYIGW